MAPVNIYRRLFTATCPNNGRRILYILTVETTRIIMVEQIVAACEAVSTGFHEEIADSLARLFGGRQVLRAHHHGVDIKTRRGALNARGELAC